VKSYPEKLTSGEVKKHMEICHVDAGFSHWEHAAGGTNLTKKQWFQILKHMEI
jgi:hypothetical protein